MAHSITKVENKNADWKVVEILNAAGDLISNVSVNRTNKKGEVFPDFDSIAVGAKIEGQLWESPAGKTYLFAPKGNRSAPRADNGPAASTGPTSELKNILQIQMMPKVEQTHAGINQLIHAVGALSDRLDRYLKIAGEPIKKDVPFEDSPF